MSETGLRVAQPADLPVILAMLHELGRSEGVSQVGTTLEHLQQVLFGSQPAAFCQLIVHEQAVAGFLIYSWKWATFTGRIEMYMQALYVDAAFRLAHRVAGGA